MLLFRGKICLERGFMAEISPDLNPVEGVLKFSQIKSIMKSYFKCTQHQEL